MQFACRLLNTGWSFAIDGNLVDIEGSFPDAVGIFAVTEGNLAVSDGSLVDGNRRLTGIEGNLVFTDNLVGNVGSLVAPDGSLPDNVGNLFGTAVILTDPEGNFVETDGILTDTEGSFVGIDSFCGDKLTSPPPKSPPAMVALGTLAIKAMAMARKVNWHSDLVLAYMAFPSVRWFLGRWSRAWFHALIV